MVGHLDLTALRRGAFVSIVALMTACSNDRAAPPSEPDTALPAAAPVEAAAERVRPAPADDKVVFSHAEIADRPAQSETTASLHFAGGDVSTSELLKIIAVSLDRNLVVDAPLAADTTISVRPQVRVDEAVELVRKVLISEGRQLSFSGRSILVMRVKGGVQTVSDATDVVHAVRLNFIDNKTFIDLASAFISRDRLIAPADDPSTVIFVGPAENADTIDRIAKLIDLFDLKNTQAQIVHLSRATPVDVVERVKEAIGAGSTGFPKLMPIAAMNAVMIVAPASFDTTDARLLIEKLDHVTWQDNEPVLAFHPLHRSAQEIFTVLQTLVSAMPAKPRAHRPAPKPPKEAAGGGDVTAPLNDSAAKTSSELLGVGGSGGPALATPSLIEQVSQVSDQGRSDQSPADGTPAQPSAGANADLTPPAAPTPPPAEEIPADQMSGLRQLVNAATVDRETNRIIFAGTPAQFQVLRNTLAKIDETGAEIQVEAAILQVDLTDELQFGVQYALNNAKVFGTMLSGAVSANGAIQSVLPGMIFDFAGRDASVLINALDSVTHVDIVSSPKVLVKSGEPAKVHFGQSVPVLTAQTSTPEAVLGPAISNEVVYRDVGITLQVTPTKLNEDLVELTVDETISDIAAQQVSNIQSPVFDDRSIKTKIKMKFGQTVLLGGLIQKGENDTDTGVPALSRIPVIGNLFGQKDRQTTRSEFVLLLTPRMYVDGTAPGIEDGVALRFEKAIALWQGMVAHAASPPARNRIMNKLEGP